jgi:hypothetical protein
VPPSKPQRRTRVRFEILALISVGTMINYLDRTVLGIAAPSLTKELHLDAVVMGFVLLQPEEREEAVERQLSERLRYDGIMQTFIQEMLGRT